jgi:hypothetical protein
MSAWIVQACRPSARISAAVRSGIAAGQRDVGAGVGDR